MIESFPSNTELLFSNSRLPEVASPIANCSVFRTRMKDDQKTQLKITGQVENVKNEIGF